MKITLQRSEPLHVPTIVGEQEVQSYIERGYLVVEDLMTDMELNELKAETLRIARGEYPCEHIQPAASDLTDQQVLERILCIHQPHYISPVIERYVRHAKISGVLSQIVGAHLRQWDGSVKAMQSMLFVKPPGFQGQAWHQDEIYIPTRDRTLCGAWIAIDDATIDNGCLWVIGGSHRSGYLFPQRPHNQPDEFDFADQSYGFDESDQTPVEVRAGTVVFFNGYLLHRSRRNQSSVYRRVLVNHYMNAWSLLPWQIGEGEHAANADFRCVLPVAGTDPYAWKGYEQAPEGVGLRWCQAADEQADADAS